MVFLTNCSSDDDSAQMNQEFSPELLNGNWRIGFFADENEDLTSTFAGYTIAINVSQQTAAITFNGNSQTVFVEVFQDLVQEENQWIVYIDFDDYNDPGDADFDDLDEDWIVTNLNSNATTIEFEERFSNNTPEQLHLTKL